MDYAQTVETPQLVHLLGEVAFLKRALMGFKARLKDRELRLIRVEASKQKEVQYLAPIQSCHISRWLCGVHTNDPHCPIHAGPCTGAHRAGQQQLVSRSPSLHRTLSGTPSVLLIARHLCERLWVLMWSRAGAEGAGQVRALQALLQCCKFREQASKTPLHTGNRLHQHC